MLLVGVVDDWDSPKAHARLSPSPSLKPTSGSLTKEEKAAEMARRKEERKQVCCGKSYCSFLMFHPAHCTTEGTEESDSHVATVYLAVYGSRRYGIEFKCTHK
jgi:hypothetical protein